MTAISHMLACSSSRGFKLRHMTFIEMMAPVFRRDVLQQVRPLFELGFESGIDLIWCNQCFETQMISR